MTTKATERVRRYIVIHEPSGRIVATCGGTHAMMERVCERLDRAHRSTFTYDDASAAPDYLPQFGPNIRMGR